MKEIRTPLLELLTRKAILDGRLTRARIEQHGHFWAESHLGVKGLAKRAGLIVARAPAGCELRSDFHQLKNPYLEYVQVGASGFLLFGLHTQAWQHRLLVPLRTEEQRGFARRAAAVRPSVAYMFECASGGVLQQLEHVCAPSRLEMIAGPNPAANNTYPEHLREALSLALNPEFMAVRGLAKTTPLHVSLAVPSDEYGTLLWGADESE